MTIPSAWTTIEDAIHAWIVAGTGLAASAVIWEAQAAPRPTGAYVSMRLGGMEARGVDWLDVVDEALTWSPKAATADAGTDVLTSAAHGLLTGDGPVRIASTGALPGGLGAGADYWIVKTGANTVQLAASFLDAKAVVPVVVDMTSAGSGAITIESTPDTRRAGAEVQHRARGPRVLTLTLNAWGGLTGTGHGAASPVALLTAALNAARLPAVHGQLVAAGVGIAQRDPVRSLDGLLAATTSEARATVTLRLNVAAEVSEAGTYIERATLTNEATGGTVTVDAQ